MKTKVGDIQKHFLRTFHGNNIFCFTHFTSILNPFQKNINQKQHFNNNNEKYTKAQKVAYGVLSTEQVLQGVSYDDLSYYPTAIIVDTDTRIREYRINHFYSNNKHNSRSKLHWKTFNSFHLNTFLWWAPQQQHLK